MQTSFLVWAKDVYEEKVIVTVKIWGETVHDQTDKM